MPRALLLALCLGSAGGVALAACDSGLAERMHGKLHPNRALDHERAVCQPWRAFPGRSIVVLPLPRPGSEADMADYDLDVLVVQHADNGNTERMTVVSRLFQPLALREDAMRITDIRVDTARYRLADDVRAFGVRVRYQGSSRFNPFANETLTLYAPQGARLAKLLDALEMNLERGEWDLRCAGRFETVRSDIAIGPGASQGHADLLLRRTRSDSVSRLQGEECITQEQPARLDTVPLRYDGRAYRLPKKPLAD